MKPEFENRYCILTVDLEEWYHGAYPGYNYDMVDKNIERVVPATKKILRILDRYGVNATFFVLGEVAEQYSCLIQEIVDKGNEIASHGFRHIKIDQLGEKGFEDDLKKSIDVIRKVSGINVKGYRAPNFSVNPARTDWAFRILKKYGIEYDSSIFPAIMYYGGATSSNRFIGEISGIEEYPPSCFDFAGVRISFSGGFYFRVYPRWLIDYGIRDYFRRGKTPVLYIHPKDIDPETPTLPLGSIKN
ncbi:polysaccharide deacetylase family protein, partial [bacterium]|nr:polysaccharide deacetylase family protein [bacterium]